MVFHDDGEFLLQGLEVAGVLAEAVSFVVHEDGNVFHVLQVFFHGGTCHGNIYHDMVPG